jgi:hypothetical protein
MHALDPRPRFALVAAIAALGLGAALALLPSSLADVDLGFGGFGSHATSGAVAARPAQSHARPDWLSNPLELPLAELRSAR